MIGNANFNLTQSVSSFSRFLGLPFNKEQIIVKVKMVALVVLANSVPLASAIYGCERSCMLDCSMTREDCLAICAHDCLWKPT